MTQQENPQSRIHNRLAAAEAEHNVRVLYACESGSRAWGFASVDSDYDVRFLYVRSPDWYLSVNVERKRDVIEYPIVDDLDINGWDFRKALMLFRKSNPPLLEWLASPIVYREWPGFADELRGLAATYSSPAAMSHHYLSMSRGNFREFLHGESVIRKKYFYVLRPLLAIRWIEKRGTPPPVEFQRLVDETLDDSRVLSALTDLLAEKRGGMEKDRGPRVPALSEFIEQELATRDHSEFAGGASTSIEPLNELFRRTVAEAWPPPRAEA